MRFLGNLLWLILGGIVAALIWAVIGLLLCVTIIGIPFGLQCLKIAGFVMWPFGRDVTLGKFGLMGALGNIIWILICGIELCLTHLVFGLLLCITIVGIPFGLQHFKLAKLALIPFGAQIHSK
ncbi:MAG: YccF domain-containing protein [Clostridiales bacterium]|nr:YccF domain-containing protein [Clostridiales bacterium]MDR2712937.1 YccF domain-containing protein [Clostridiales bacterium]